jgi:hypothetical protein
MMMRVFNVFAVVILTIAWWLVAGFLFGAASLDRLIVLTIIGWLFASIVVFVAKKVSHTAWIIYAGLIVLVALFLPDAMIIEISAHLPQPFEDPMTFTILLTLPVALVVAALLLYSGLNLHKKWRNAGLEEDRVSQARRKHTGRASVVALVLSALVLAKVLHNFYWFMVWDTTGDSLGNGWLAFPILVVLFSSALLFSLLPDKAKLAGFSYLLLIPALIAVSTRAQSVDFRQLTEARAERARQAVEAYYAREGRYPQNLQQLTPWYAISLPGPVIIYGQGWCYQGGQDYYRLGYLDREHWSSPILFGRVYSAKGHSPLKVDICQPAIDTYRAQHPDWDRVLQDYGRPTPTPDIGE